MIVRDYIEIPESAGNTVRVIKSGVGEFSAVYFDDSLEEFAIVHSIDPESSEVDADEETIALYKSLHRRVHVPKGERLFLRERLGDEAYSFLSSVPRDHFLLCADLLEKRMSAPSSMNRFQRRVADDILRWLENGCTRGIRVAASPIDKRTYNAIKYGVPLDRQF